MKNIINVFDVPEQFDVVLQYLIDMYDCLLLSQEQVRLGEYDVPEHRTEECRDLYRWMVDNKVDRIDVGE